MLKKFEEYTVDSILEEYGLLEVFSELNESDDKVSQMIQKVKAPFASALHKLKSKFGDDFTKIISDIVKKASKLGKKTLLCVLATISLIMSTNPAAAKTCSDFDKTFVKNYAEAVVYMGKANNLSDVKWEEVKGKESYKYAKLLSSLELDGDKLYASSGVGCSENSIEAYDIAKKNVVEDLSKKYGENFEDEYGVEYTVIRTENLRKIINGDYSEYHTVIIVAYQNINK